MALIDRDYFEMLPLGLKKTAEPFAEALDVFIQNASEQVESYCERKFELQDHVETHYGTGSNKILLEQYPAHAVNSITYEDEFGGPYSIDVSYVRLHPSGILEWKFPLTNGPWRRDRMYVINYEAGFETIPGPIKHATALWVTELMRPNFAGPQPERAAELVPLSSEQIIDLLDNYRRRRIG